MHPQVEGGIRIGGWNEVVVGDSALKNGARPGTVGTLGKSKGMVKVFHSILYSCAVS